MSDEASPRPWRAIYARILDARGKTVCVCEKDSMHGRADDKTAEADAALIVDAVNAIYETKKLSVKLYDPIRRAEAERDRLRAELDALQTSYNELHAELADKTRNYEDVIAYHMRSEEKLKKVIRSLLTLRRGDIVVPMDMEKKILAEARAALGETNP